MGNAGQKRIQEELLPQTPIAPLPAPNGAARALDARHNGVLLNGSAHAAHAAPAHAESAPAAAPRALPVASETSALPVPVRAALVNAPLVLVGLAAAASGSLLWAGLWCAACRLAYVLFVGFSLQAESQSQALSRRSDPETAWRTFRARASLIMVADAVALAALSVATRGTITLPVPEWLVVVVGLALIVIGIGIKYWATASLSAGTFYWRDFFVPPEHRSFSATGPYRWLSNPMYTVGYAHAYGFALLMHSGAGLVGAVCAQIAVNLLAILVERPHVRRFANRGR